jgi:hypothetical protein
MYSERRRSPRVPLEQQLAGRVEVLGVDLVIRNVSFGGFLAEASHDFIEREVVPVRLSLRDGSWSDVFDARVISCRERRVPDEAPYLVGFAFAGTETWDPRVHMLMDRLVGTFNE